MGRGRPGDRQGCRVEEVGVRTGAADDSGLGSVCGWGVEVARTLRACSGRTYSSLPARRRGLCSGPVGSLPYRASEGGDCFQTAHGLFSTLCLKRSVSRFRTVPTSRCPKGQTTAHRHHCPVGQRPPPARRMTNKGTQRRQQLRATPATANRPTQDHRHPLRPFGHPPHPSTTLPVTGTANTHEPSPRRCLPRASERHGHPGKPAPPRPSVEAATPPAPTAVHRGRRRDSRISRRLASRWVRRICAS